MSLTTLQADLRYRLGVPSSDSFYTDTIVTALINYGIDFLSHQWDWRWLETTASISATTSTQSYSVPSDYRRTISVTDSTGVPLKAVPITELNYMTSAQAATARFYCVYGTKVYLFPVPSGSATYTHWYIGEETALSSGGDTPSLPVAYQPVAITKAAALAEERAGNDSKAAQLTKEFEASVALMRQEATGYADSRGGGAEPTPKTGP